jgi:hypothetical protein
MRNPMYREARSPIKPRKRRTRTKIRKVNK